MSVDISDHALVRYIERVCGETLEPYRAELRALLALPPADDDASDEGGLIKIVVEGNNGSTSVVTVLGADQRVKKQRGFTMRRIVRVYRPAEAEPDFAEVPFDG